MFGYTGKIAKINLASKKIYIIQLWVITLFEVFMKIDSLKSFFSCYFNPLKLECDNPKTTKKLQALFYVAHNIHTINPLAQLQYRT